MTGWVYRLPPGATRTKVIDHYDDPGSWRMDARDRSRRPYNCEVSYKRNGAVLYVNACTSGGLLTIQIDHAALG